MGKAIPQQYLPAIPTGPVPDFLYQPSAQAFFMQVSRKKKIPFLGLSNGNPMGRFVRNTEANCPYFVDLSALWAIRVKEADDPSGSAIGLGVAARARKEGLQGQFRLGRKLPDKTGVATLVIPSRGRRDFADVRPVQHGDRNLSADKLGKAKKFPNAGRAKKGSQGGRTQTTRPARPCPKERLLPIIDNGQPRGRLSQSSQDGTDFCP